MINAKLYPLFAVCLIAGCATKPASVAANNSDVQCHDVARTGTMIKSTVCTTQAERDAEQRNDAAVRDAVDGGPRTGRTEGL
jgi:hypothetical protein